MVSSLLVVISLSLLSFISYIYTSFRKEIISAEKKFDFLKELVAQVPDVGNIEEGADSGTERKHSKTASSVSNAPTFSDSTQGSKKRSRGR